MTSPCCARQCWVRPASRQGPPRSKRSWPLSTIGNGSFDFRQCRSELESTQKSRARLCDDSGDIGRSGIGSHMCGSRIQAKEAARIARALGLTASGIESIIKADASNLHAAFQPVSLSSRWKSEALQTFGLRPSRYLGHSMSKILVVEDSPEFREMLVTVLQANGHTVMTAQNGLQAIRKVELGNPDLIITDIHMPALNGLEMIRWIRLNSSSKAVP